MANIALVTQSALENVTLANGVAQVTQSVIEFIAGLGMSCGSPPAGQVGLAYNHTFPAGGGDPPYIFTISAGALPNGLVLNPLTGAATGTPVLPGLFTFTVTITDSLFASTSVTCSINIRGNPAALGGTGGKTGIRAMCCRPFILAAERLRTLLARRQAWPYAHLFAQTESIPVNQVASIDAPLNGLVSVVLAYQVPSGFRFIMQAILQDCSAPFLPGDASWTVDLNRPVVANVQAMGIQGLTAMPVPLGSLRYGLRHMWLLPRPYTFEPLSVIRSKVTTTAAIPPGPGTRFTSGFFGFLEPAVKAW